VSKIKSSPKLLSGILVALFFAIALSIRVVLPYDKIFVGDWIKFASTDTYYIMRLVDNLVHNFPHMSTFDPYLLYPGGSEVSGPAFFQQFLAGITWVIGLGSPTQHTIDVVGVYYPAVLGALTVIPVYFIGKELFGRWAGVLSAGLLAILPGEFLGRSLLGATDYHVAETLFTTVTMLFLILAIKTASQRQLTFGHLKRRNWTTIRRPLIYSLLAGVFLGIYIFTWAGALLFVFIIAVYFVVQSIIDHLRHKSTEYLCFVGVILFCVALIMLRTISADPFYLVPLIIAILIPLVLSGLSWLMARKKIRAAYYPLTLLGLGLAGWGLFYLINPSLLNLMLSAFSIFRPTGAQLTTIEMQPLISSMYDKPLSIAWGNFTTGFFLSLVSLGILIYLVIKQGNAEKTILLVWSLVILAATLGQRRFGYYYAVNVALLTGYLSVVIYYVARFIGEYFAGKSTSHLWSQILEFAGFKEPGARPVDTPKKDYYQVLGISRKATTREIRQAFLNLAFKRKSDSGAITDDNFKKIREAYEVLSKSAKRAAYDRSEYTLATKAGRRAASKEGGRPTAVSYVVMAFAVLVIFFVVFFGNIQPAIATASAVQYAPSDAWVSSLTWMKEDTPEPFDNPDAYYQLEASGKYSSVSVLMQSTPNPTGDPDFYYHLEQSYPYPESAYGVLAWWDYGYWITRIAHRIPNANPSQDPASLTTVASFFIAQDEKSANEIAQKLSSAYIIIDNQTAYIDPITASGKFWAVATWAGRQPSEYFDFYLIPQDNNWILRPLFYPEYYRTLVVRLYNFDGKAVTPESVWVISYQENTDKAGNIYKLITGAQQFDTYEEAQAYVSSQESGNYRIVSMNPMLSPVPVEAVEHYKLVHSSDNITLPDGKEVPEIKIFEYID
jgi:oligosaccharyl transferase (archaeosortase A-associated)